MTILNFLFAAFVGVAVLFGLVVLAMWLIFRNFNEDENQYHDSNGKEKRRQP